MIRILELKINPLFRDKIPPLTPNEYERLEKNILADGYVRDPIITWNRTILDGHNRYSIIKKHPELESSCKIEEKDFADEYEAVAWMCSNQLGRRNLTEQQKMKLVQEEYDARMKTSGGQIGNLNAMKNELEESSNSIPVTRKRRNATREMMSEEHNLTEGAIKSSVEWGRGVDAAEEVSPGFKNKILSGEVKVPKGKVAELRKADPEERKEKVEEMLAPKPKSDKEIRKAMNNSIKSMQNVSQECTVTIDDAINQFETDEDHYTELVETSLKRYSSVIKGNEERIVAVFEGLVADLKRIIKEYKLK